MKTFERMVNDKWQIITNKNEIKLPKLRDFINLLEGISFLSPKCFKLLDYQDHKMYLVGSSESVLLGHSFQIVNKKGFYILDDILLSEEKRLLYMCMREEAHKLLLSYKPSERQELILSYKMVVKSVDKHLQQVNEIIFPVSLDEQGNVHYSLTISDVVPFKGEIIHEAFMYDKKRGKVFKYDVEKHIFEEFGQYVFSIKELQIVRMRKLGLSINFIATALGLSNNTIRNTLNKIYEKAGGRDLAYILVQLPMIKQF
jgi:DNA-binding CsgD family transcriptional regulator